MPDSPADTLRAAATLMRQRAARAASAGHTGGAWKLRPWAVTECWDSDKSAEGCACIVYQGEYAPVLEPQVPLIQYVADAETEAHATFIASMHPGVGLAVAEWLDFSAKDMELTYEDGPECPNCGEGCGGHDAEWVCGRCGKVLGDDCHCWDAALNAARAYLGETDG